MSEFLKELQNLEKKLSKEIAKVVINSTNSVEVVRRLSEKYDLNCFVAGYLAGRFTSMLMYFMPIYDDSGKVISVMMNVQRAAEDMQKFSELIDKIAEEIDKRYESDYIG